MNVITCPCCGNSIPVGAGKVEGKTQKDRLANVLKDFKPHSTFELVRKVYGVNVATVARLASRVDDLRREGWIIIAQKSKKQSNKWWYCALKTQECVYVSDIYESQKRAEALMSESDATAGEYE